MKYEILIGLLIVLVIINGCQQKEKPQFTDEEKLEYAMRLWTDIGNYIEEHDDNLTTQLKMVKNGTADSVVDPILQQKVDVLHDYLTESLTADEVVKLGLEGMLWQIYDIDDVLNPKNVTMINIRGKDE